MTEDCSNKTGFRGVWIQTWTRNCTNPKYGGLTCEAVSDQPSTKFATCPTRKKKTIIFPCKANFMKPCVILIYEGVS